jgi:hypothetical protein
MTPSLAQSRPVPTGYVFAIAILVLIAVAKPILMDTLDPDCFWHLRVGEQIAREGARPLIDHLSFASVREPWTPYSWLAELGMLALWNAGGWKAAIAANAAMNGAFVLLTAACCRELQRTRMSKTMAEEYVGAFNTVIATATAILWSLAYLSFRPATMAIVLLALIAYLILRDRRIGEKTGAVWWVLSITVLLANIHLSVMLVPLWFAACWVGSAWEWYRNQTTHTLSDLHRRFRRYGILTTGTLVASLATPMLGGVLETIRHYRADDVMVSSKVIAEMQPFYAGSWGAVSAVLVALLLIATARNFRRLRKGELLCLMGMTLFLFRLGRFAPLFAIIAAPVAAVVWPRLSDGVLWRKPIAAMLGLVLVLGTWNTLRSFPGPITSLDQWLNRHAAYASGYPTRAADFVAANVDPGHGRLINEFNWGGYLEWRLGDHYQTLMDGRTQLFSRQFWTDTCLTDRASRRRAVEQADGDVAILPSGKNGLADTLRELGWRVVWSDRQSQVLLPPGGEARLHDPISIGHAISN